MRAIIAAAGTAGHINPGIAIANKIKENEPNSEIIFIGTNRGLENDLVTRAGYELKTLDAYGLKKELSITNLKHIFSTIKSKKVAQKIISDFKPDIVIGTGGYICGPVMASAISLKVPTVLHESNAYPGKAVKMFSGKVDKILVGFEDAKERLKNDDRVVVTGNPTKTKKLSIDIQRKKNILENLGIKNDLPIVLVFGGSQGAQRINETMISLLKNNLNESYQIIWATGQNQYEILKDKLEEENLYFSSFKNAKILPYIYNMEELMNVSDLIICRSGAMTITEISICEKPAIFIPLPSMSANRQEDNARVLQKLGAAEIILNDELNEYNLSQAIDSIICDNKKLIEMGKKSGQIAIENADTKIYNEIKSLLKN